MTIASAVANPPLSKAPQRTDGEGFAGHRTPTRARKLHLGHFAFMRAVVQGIEVRASWNHYLRIEGEASDVRLVRSTIAWIRDEFAAAARRENRFGTARLVLVDVSRIPEPVQQLSVSLQSVTFDLSIGTDDPFILSPPSKVADLCHRLRHLLQVAGRRNRVEGRQMVTK